MSNGALNIEVLSHDFIPPRLIYREKEYEEILMELKSFEMGFPPPNLVILGPPGSGKTVTVRKALKDRQSPHVYLISERSAYGTMCSMSAILVGRRKWGLSMGVLWDDVERSMPSPCIVVLDEAEKFVVRDERSDDLLYYILNRPKTGLMLISSRMDIYDHIKDPRVRSRFTPRFILFPPYRPEEICAILKDRLELARVPQSSVDEAALRLISALASRKGGDARYAIDLLRESVRLWIVEGAGGVLSEEHVRAAKEKVELSYMREGFRSLSSAHKLMLLSALKSETVGETYRRFHELAKDCGLPEFSDRRLKEILGELKEMGYIYVRRIGKKYYVEVNEWAKRCSDLITREGLGAEQ